MSAFRRGCLRSWRSAPAASSAGPPSPACTGCWCAACMSSIAAMTEASLQCSMRRCRRWNEHELDHALLYSHQAGRCLCAQRSDCTLAGMSSGDLHMSGELPLAQRARDGCPRTSGDQPDNVFTGVGSRPWSQCAPAARAAPAGHGEGLATWPQMASTLARSGRTATSALLNTSSASSAEGMTAARRNTADHIRQDTEGEV